MSTLYVNFCQYVSTVYVGFCQHVSTVYVSFCQHVSTLYVNFCQHVATLYICFCQHVSTVYVNLWQHVSECAIARRQMSECAIKWQQVSMYVDICHYISTGGIIIQRCIDQCLRLFLPPSRSAFHRNHETQWHINMPTTAVPETWFHLTGLLSTCIVSLRLPSIAGRGDRTHTLTPTLTLTLTPTATALSPPPIKELLHLFNTKLPPISSIYAHFSARLLYFWDLHCRHAAIYFPTCKTVCMDTTCQIVSFPCFFIVCFHYCLVCPLHNLLPVQVQTLPEDAVGGQS